MAMKARMISLTEPQEAYLRKEAERLGIAIPDLIRRIIDEHRDRKQSGTGGAPRA